MKRNTFNSWSTDTLSKKEILILERYAKMEETFFKLLQEEVARAVKEYKEENNIGFNDLVQKLRSSTRHLNQIQKGNANLTLCSLAHLSVVLNKKPRIVFEKI